MTSRRIRATVTDYVCRPFCTYQKGEWTEWVLSLTGESCNARVTPTAHGNRSLSWSLHRIFRRTCIFSSCQLHFRLMQRLDRNRADRWRRGAFRFARVVAGIEPCARSFDQPRHAAAIVLSAAVHSKRMLHRPSAFYYYVTPLLCAHCARLHRNKEHPHENVSHRGAPRLRLRFNVFCVF